MAAMRCVSAGTQAGIFDTRLLAGFLVDLLEKCTDIQKDFNRCADNIKQGRMQVNQTETTMNNMQLSLGRFTDTVDNLSSQTLQVRTNGVQRNQQVDRLRKEIACREDHLAKLMEQSVQGGSVNNGRRLQDIHDERAHIEHHLSRVKRNIDQTFEDLSEVEEKFEMLQELHAKKQAEADTGLNAVKDQSMDITLRKRRILSIDNGDTTIDLSDLYASPATFRKLQVEIEDLKHRQIQTERHIQMQLDERAFLKQTAEAIIRKVSDLEMKVRKETGDHGFHSRLTTEPDWYQDLGAPSVWHSSSVLTPEQLKNLREKQNIKYGTPQVLEIEDSPSANQELTVTDLTSK